MEPITNTPKAVSRTDLLVVRISIIFFISFPSFLFFPFSIHRKTPGGNPRGVVIQVQQVPGNQLTMAPGRMYLVGFTALPYSKTS